MSAAARRIVGLARWALLLTGVGLTTWSFVRLTDVRLRIAAAAPWWWLGIIGAAVTLLALGSPWPARARDRDEP